MSSLTVKDRRRKDSGRRMKLDKHLPRCFEPRRGKWVTAKNKDPRDKFGWDYFDYDVCPAADIFPCGGPDQLKRLVEQDWRVANETGALNPPKSSKQLRGMMNERLANLGQNLQNRDDLKATIAKNRAKREAQQKLQQQQAQRQQQQQQQQQQSQNDHKKQSVTRRSILNGLAAMLNGD
jgi:hypothetical protein